MILKRFVFVFLLCALGMTAVYAQRGIKPAKSASQALLAPEEVSRLLQKRVGTSFEKARLALENVPPLVQISLDNNTPYQALSRPIKNPQKIYPQMANLLTTRQQWSDFVVASYNRRIVAQIPQETSMIQELQQHTPELYQRQQVLPADENNSVELLAQQIPPDTQYLLLGEAHLESIEKYVARLLPEIRDRNPGREIILLTEFLYEGAHSRLNWIFAKHDEVFASAEMEQIPFIGLSPRFIRQNQRVFLKGETSSKRLWESLEGLALRNQYWLEIIRQQRLQHPDALFIIYAGATHLSYNKPYSVAKSLMGDKTFTVFLFPQDLLDNEEKLLMGESTLANEIFPYEDLHDEHEMLLYASPYDYFSVTNGMQPHSLIKFNKPDAFTVGFDVRLFLK